MPLWKIRPRGAGAQDEEYARKVKYLTPTAPRATVAVLAPLWFRDQRVQARPLRIRQISLQRRHTSIEYR
jgi:hypothetical protein